MYLITDLCVNFIKNSNYKLFLLYGDLGSGKTTVIRNICKFIGINNNILSPTFSLVNEYKSNIINVPIYHCDMYRISNINEIYEIGILDYIFNDSIVFIEWPEIIFNLLFGKVNIVNIYITKESFNLRTFLIKQITI